MAPARCSVDSSEVTLIVAQTRMYMAARVIATIRIVVTIEARIFFIGPGCDQETDHQRIAQMKKGRQLSVLNHRFCTTGQDRLSAHVTRVVQGLVALAATAASET